MGLWKKVAENRTVRSGAFQGSWEGPFDVSINEPGKTQRFSRSRNTEEMETFNERLKSWGNKVRSALPVSISSHGIGGKQLKRSIRNTYYYEFGEIFRLGFSFAREGIFVHKGVGRGYNMVNGMVVKTSKTSGFNRKPKPWFNPVVESFIPELEQIIKEYTETAIVNSSRIYIR
ncbi:MAG: hypothetical protein NTW16_09985 [Bacteroidetes bacterium]|nr:hypothetical protein [Bacteroidota bacterium]